MIIWELIETVHFAIPVQTIKLRSVSKVREPSPNYPEEKDSCLEYFDKWIENEQLEFVQALILRMCHYQHGQINTFLKPMLQRDFITALPSKSNARA